LAKSEETRCPPVMTRLIFFLLFSYRYFFALYKANRVGIDVAALTNLGEDPVEPARPSRVMKSGPEKRATSRSSSI